jgi:hypothetical protein
LALIVSDGLDPDLLSALRILGGRGYEIGFVQVLADLDLDPDIEGDLRLLDSETDAHVEITANAPTLKAYRRRLEEHCASIEEECLRYGGRYLLVKASEDLEPVVQRMRRTGWVAS